MGKFRIGIDPDLEKSGFAMIVNKKISSMDSLPFFELTFLLNGMKAQIEIVVIEAGWLNEKTMFHFKKDKFGNKTEYGKGVSEKIAMLTGQNHAVGKLLVEFCKINRIPYKTYKPSGAKWDAKLLKGITGWDGRSNQETRDAVRAAWL